MTSSLQTRRAVLGGLLALVAAGSRVAAPLAAKPVDEKDYKWVGEHLLCQCGCGSTVYGCNHYGCSEAAELRKAVRDSLAVADSPEAALKMVGEKYGQKVLAEPPTTGFNLTAWIMPFAALAGGLLVVMAVLKGWRAHHTAHAAITPAVDPKLLARYQAGIDEEIEKD